MEMYQSKAISHTFFLKNVQCLQQFTAGESEFASVATAFFPFSTTCGSQFDAYPNIWAHIMLFGQTRNNLQLVEFLNDNKDSFAHLLCQKGQFYITLIFISITDNKRITLTLHGNDSMQLWFGTCFKTKIEFASMTYYFLYHRLHLVNLDRINNKILSFEIIFFSCLFETTACLLNTIVKNIRES